MSTFKTFEDIEVWQIARQLTQSLYGLTRQGEFAKDFALKDQIRKASVSIMSNIAEGFERSGTKEFVQFLAIAKVRQERYALNCMLPLIKVTLTKRISR